MRRRMRIIPRLQADAAGGIVFILQRAVARHIYGIASDCGGKSHRQNNVGRSQQAIIDWQDSGPSRCIREDFPRWDGIEEDIDQHGAAAKHQGRQHYCLQSDVTGAKQQLPASMLGKGGGRG